MTLAFEPHWKSVAVKTGVCLLLSVCFRIHIKGTKARAYNLIRFSSIQVHTDHLGSLLNACSSRWVLGGSSAFFPTGSWMLLVLLVCVHTWSGKDPRNPTNPDRKSAGHKKDTMEKMTEREAIQTFWGF